jgi:hypothetical protein
MNAQQRARSASLGLVAKKFFEYVTSSQRLSAKRPDMVKARKMGGSAAKKR